jgi:hypothetical protein
MGHAYVKYFFARRVWTDQRRVEGVGGGGGQPGGSAREGLSLNVDRHVEVELTQGGHTTPEARRPVSAGGAARSSGGIIHINCRRKTLCGEFEYVPQLRGLFGCGNGYHALPHRYPPLSIGIPSIRECESGSTRRPELEARVLDGRADRWVEGTAAG